MRMNEITQSQPPVTPGDQEKKNKRYQWQQGPASSEFGAPEQTWDVDQSGKQTVSKDYTNWRAGEQGKAHMAAQAKHQAGQSAAYQKHTAQRGQFDTTIEEFTNPFFNPSSTEEENDEPELIDIGVDYTMTSEPYVPARVQYDDNDHPAEGGETEVNVSRVVDLDSGRDITAAIDMAALEERIAGSAEPEQYRENTLLESIKRLSGLK